jgi:signal transduction histidine kinase
MILPRFGLGLKFIVLVSLLILITSFGLSRVFLSHLENEEADNQRTLGLTLARNLAYNAELGVLTRNREMLADLCRGPMHDTEVAYLRVLSASGDLLASADAEAGLQITSDPEAPAPDAMRGEATRVSIQIPNQKPFDGLEVRVPVTTTGRQQRNAEVGFLLEASEEEPRRRETIGTAVVGLSLATTQAEIAALRNTFGGVTAAVVVFGILMTVLIVQVVVRPVKQMVAATRRIALGNLDEKVETSSRDELGELGRSFNRMTENLKQSRFALESYSADLEEKVRQRTVELERAQSQLIQAEKMSAMGELVSGVAHELNNPLAGILGYSQLLLGAPVEEKARRGLDRINREAERCRRIVQNLQVFARKHKPQKNYIGINGILESTLELRAYQMQVDNIQVSTRLQPDLPMTMADFHQLQQVFMNLLVNAHHAVKEANRPGRLEIRTEARDGKILVHVEDNGSGIAPENLRKIFDPFFTTKEVGQGTGLGLSICYGIVHEHRGRIGVQSQEGSGTTFTVELPIFAATAEAVAESEPEPAVAPAAAPPPAVTPGRRNILVIDDEESIVDVLHQALQTDGHRVDTAGNGNVGLRKIRQGHYDVIISDLKMPGMSGMDLYDSVHRFAPEMARRIIFSTGDVASHDTRAFLERSGNRYLQKPFDLETIRHVIADVLAERIN